MQCILCAGFGACFRYLHKGLFAATIAKAWFEFAKIRQTLFAMARKFFVGEALSRNEWDTHLQHLACTD